MPRPGCTSNSIARNKVRKNHVRCGTTYSPPSHCKERPFPPGTHDRPPSHRAEPFLSKPSRFGPNDARDAFLDQACAGNPQLREEVQALLKSYDAAGAFLETPIMGDFVDSETLVLPERPGASIGPYKLLQQIGEGGMGVVYLAEQTSPVERRVALKIIKPGMDTRQVIARFEAERQALALMDHPNIAKVFDAGDDRVGPALLRDGVGQAACRSRSTATSTSLRPGSGWNCCSRSARPCSTPIKRGSFIATSSPPTFSSPNTTDKPVPKVIDFGVAKAISQKLTDKTACSPILARSSARSST